MDGFLVFMVILIFLLELLTLRWLGEMKEKVVDEEEEIEKELSQILAKLNQPPAGTATQLVWKLGQPTEQQSKSS